MQMPGRKYTQGGQYRYGFNGKENDNDVKGEGNQQDYGMRIYDPRLGRFLSVDPLDLEYPFYTPFQFSGNNPIKFVDVDGKEPGLNELVKQYKGNLSQIDGSKSVMRKYLEPYISALKIRIQNSAGKEKGEFQLKLNLSQAGYGILMQNIYRLQRENDNIEKGFVAISKIAAQLNMTLDAMQQVAQMIPLLKRRSEVITGTAKEQFENVQSTINETQSQGASPQKGINNPKTKDAADLGNRVHYDEMNGGTGEALPTELQMRYPETQFRFLRRGQKGADVEVVGGQHPSEYQGSTWSSENNFGDFKPNTSSGKTRFKSEVKSGKLPQNTQRLSYDPVTGKLNL